MPGPAGIRHTVVVADALGFATARRRAAGDGALGRQVVTLERLVALLAGPFLRAPDAAVVRSAVARAPVDALHDLAPIARLPGFVRAAASALQLAWDEAIDPARPPTDHRRWAALLALERAVAAALPGDVRLPRELARTAVSRARWAPALLGPITLHHLQHVPAVWRPVLAAVADHVPVRWVRLDDARPAWLPLGIAVERRPPSPGEALRVACATPAHEALEAVRWARSLVVGGVAPGAISIAAATTASYDGALLAAAGRAGIPLHAVHGVPLLTRADGQAAAALADALVRGPSLDRVRRAADAVQGALAADDERRLPSGWWRALPEEAPLTTLQRWRRALEGTGSSVSPGAARWLLDLVAALERGAPEAAALGERYLTGDALAGWRRALHDAPADALAASLARLKVGDGLEPTSSVAWGPAATIARSPRPYVRVLGLSARSWPRAPSDDPLLPPHVLGSVQPSLPAAPTLDREAFDALMAHAAERVVLSRARRDGDGKALVASPLLRTGAAADVPEAVVALRGPNPAPLDEGERLAARPGELARDGHAQRAAAAYHAWRAPDLGPHDGAVRPDHPVVRRAMGRRHSATSLRSLLRDPLGFTWRYGLGWKEPPDQEEPLSLDPRHFGTLVHEVLESATRDLDAAGGIDRADAADLDRIVDAAVALRAGQAEERIPVPPAWLWRRTQVEVRELALAALRQPFEPWASRSYAEVPFGGGRSGRAEDGDWPWDPDRRVRLLDDGMEIGGTIDRLDLSADGRRARVVDYKTGRLDKRTTRGLAGGRELQRCLYATAVRSLLAPETAIDAYLVYPRSQEAFRLDDPEATVQQLRAAVAGARDALLAGAIFPGPDAFTDHAETRFALPASARRGYDDRTLPLVREAVPVLAALWSEA